MLLNLNHTISKYQNIKYLTGVLNRQSILDNLSTNGYCLYRDTNLHKNLLSDNDMIVLNTTEHVAKCLFGDDYGNKLMNYSMGTDARDKYKNSALLTVSKISSTHWVPYHNELLYTNEFPRIIAFICLKPSRIGGHTLFANTIDFYQQLPEIIRNKFNKYGIMYIRNLRDKTSEETVPNNSLFPGGQKCVQDIFNTTAVDRTNIEHLCEYYGYEYEWNECAINKTPILRIKYVAPAIVDYQFGDNMVRSFANSVTGNNGRYFKDYNEYYDKLEYIDRPFHSLWGNGEEFNDDEYAVIEDIYSQCSIKFGWEHGDVFIADNLCWAHGRTPYEGERSILAIMGEPYTRYPFMIGKK